MNTPIGFAVVDTETTGILPGHRHRIVEVAVIQLDGFGVVTGQWSTLLNPDRDLGPQSIHGIRAAEVRRAPQFEQIAGDLIELFRGRIVVAHNWQFDAAHLRSEFERIGIETPFYAQSGLCTMQAAGLVLPGSGRSLIDCCTTAGLPEMRWHSALDDALGAAALFSHMLGRSPTTFRSTVEQLNAAQWSWPALACGVIATVSRTPSGHVEPHFLARLVERMPRDGEPVVDAYFSLLDDALLDRQISATEADALIEAAYQLGMHKADVLAVHHTYLRALAYEALSDGDLTKDERSDLQTVAVLLGLDRKVVGKVLKEERISQIALSSNSKLRPVSVGGLELHIGDKVVLTGEMELARKEIQEQMAIVGLRLISAVSKQTRVLVAADPDSLSRKAKDARALGVPVIGEKAFLRFLETMPPSVSYAYES